MLQAGTGKIIFGFIPSFRSGDPVLLFLGSAASIREFAAYLGTSPLGTNSPINDSPIFLSMTNSEVTLHVKPHATGLKQINGDKTRFSWGLSPEKCKEFSDLLNDLSQAPRPSHQYLDCDDVDDVMIMVSKDEYTHEVFFPV